MVLMRVDFPRPVWPVIEGEEEGQPQMQFDQTDTQAPFKGRKLQGDFAVTNVPTQMTLNWKPRFRSLRSIWLVMLSKPT